MLHKDKDRFVFQIKAATYDQICYPLSKDFCYFERNHLWEENSTQVDVYGRFWTVAIGTVVDRQIVVKSSCTEYDLVGKHLIFIPPFSIIEWQVAKGNLKWCGFISRSKLPLDMPKEAVVYRWNGEYFGHESDLLNFVRTAGPGVVINKRETASRVAKNVKIWMDINFQTELNFCDYAVSMGVSQAYLSKEFKLCYGISPQTYLNKLRAFEGMSLLILDETNVAETSTRMGYSATSSFHRHFVEEFGARPSDFIK